MIACESEFETEDGNHPGYSLCEYDIYGWIPFRKAAERGITNHRLSVWKNLSTGEYEMYRNYNGVPSPYDADIIFKDASLMAVLDRAVDEWNYWHGTTGHQRDLFVHCDHASADRPA